MARALTWGDIRQVEFGRPDKPRPVLVITRGSAIQLLNTVTVVPITTTIRDVPSEVRLGELEGMKAPCVANLHHLQTVSQSRVGRLLGSLAVERRGEVRDALLYALELDD